MDYVYDGLDPIAEYLSPGGQHVNYQRGLDRILSAAEIRGNGTSVGGLTYYHYDGVGSVTALTKHQGQSAHDYRYSDYGTLLDNNGKSSDASNFTDPHNHYTYTGQEWDEQTVLLHFYACEYDPTTGTWLQQDPYRGQLATPTTLHRYGYVGNNPATLQDYYGYWFGVDDLVATGTGGLIKTAVNVGGQGIEDFKNRKFSGVKTYGVEAVSGFVGGATTGWICYNTAGLGCAISGGAEQITRNLLTGET